jgi:putative PIN family toxin of toxin-antitoxin system
MRVTLDSGILARGSASPTGPAARLITELAHYGLPLVLSEFILDEVRKTLGYSRMQARYGLTAEEIEARVDHLRAVSEIVVPAIGPPIVLEDPKDDPVVYTAISGNADVLCTLDHHFYTARVLEVLGRYGVQVMTDVALLRRLLL